MHRGYVKIYLDACCLNRLTDDQSQSRIAEEAEAVERILRLLRDGKSEWLSSTVLKAETSNNPDVERRYEAEVLLSLATDTIPLDGQIIRRATELEAAGYGAFDALNLSSAEAGMVTFCSQPTIDSSDGLLERLAYRACGS